MVLLARSDLLAGREKFLARDRASPRHPRQDLRGMAPLAQRPEFEERYAVDELQR